jgi:hypothetical protein
VAGALLAGRTGRSIGSGRLFWLGLVSGGLLLVVLSRMTVLPSAAVIIALAGLAFGVINAAVPPLLLAVIPPQLTGRVMAVFSPLQQLPALSPWPWRACWSARSCAACTW